MTTADTQLVRTHMPHTVLRFYRLDTGGGIALCETFTPQGVTDGFVTWRTDPDGNAYWGHYFMLKPYAPGMGDFSLYLADRRYGLRRAVADLHHRVLAEAKYNPKEVDV